LTWRCPLAVLVAVRLAIPLAALGASGHDLPGVPPYDYVPLTGDATGFYAATREFLASWGRLGVAVIGLAVATGAFAGLLARALRRRSVGRHWLVALGALGFALVVSIAVSQMHPPGAAVFGWSLVWSLPMLPYRALGAPLDPDIAFGFGLALSLLANAVTVIATAYVGLYATGRRSIGLGAAALYAFWPLLVGVVGGSRAWENGTWTVDAGLALYTEPLSTALVTLAAVLLLSARLTELRLASSGVLLSLATAVKLSNGIFAGALLALLAHRLGVRRALPYVAGLLAFAPLVASYWPMGYSAQFDTPSEQHPFSAGYVLRSWTDSLLFTPSTLLVFTPLAIVGAIALRDTWARKLLVVWALVNPVFYSFFEATPEHPRFMFASLPAVFVLWVVGLTAVVATGVNVLRRRGLKPARR
jgi:hypothetical protein